jgi:ADP-L-glycero-D-manno-heptose 6-epimerase
MSKIIITGAAGFIASNLARKLNAEGISNLILVDAFDNSLKVNNWQDLKYFEKIERSHFINWFKIHAKEVSFVFHLGARTDTAEFNMKVLETLNTEYTHSIWQICTQHQIPLVYASSAATYGMGENGFDDAHDLLAALKPLNAYGTSKHLFDLFAVEQTQQPPLWAGLKFFNVYGPHEAHKGRMASVVLHAYRQIKETGKIRLFKSHLPQYKDGEQLRDFVHVDDIVNTCLFFYNGKFTKPADSVNGIYNVGTGQARTFNDLVKPIFSTLNVAQSIEYIQIPPDIRSKYQYYTQARMDKLFNIGFPKTLISIEKGVENYVNNLMKT